MRKIAQSGEEPLNFPEELYTAGCKTKGAAMKQLNPERLFQLRKLPADCRLLYAVRHFARGSRYSPMFSDVIKKLEMMNVHLRKIIVSIDDSAKDYRLTQLCDSKRSSAHEHAHHFRNRRRLYFGRAFVAGHGTAAGQCVVGSGHSDQFDPTRHHRSGRSNLEPLARSHVDLPSAKSFQR